MSERARVAAKTTGARSEAGTLRTSTIGLISRARATLADELDAKPSLPRNLDALVFGYFDELVNMRDKPAGGNTPS